MVSTEHNHKRKETWQGWMLPVTTQVKSIFEDEWPHCQRPKKADTRRSKQIFNDEWPHCQRPKKADTRRSEHILNEIQAVVTETVYSSEISRNERNMSPVEIELLRTVGMINDTHINGKHAKQQKKACPNCLWMNGRNIQKAMVAINNATIGNLCPESVQQEEGGINTMIKT